MKPREAVGNPPVNSRATAVGKDGGWDDDQTSMGHNGVTFVCASKVFVHIGDFWVNFQGTRKIVRVWIRIRHKIGGAGRAKTKREDLLARSFDRMLSFPTYLDILESLGRPRAVNPKANHFPTIFFLHPNKKDKDDKAC